MLIAQRNLLSGDLVFFRWRNVFGRLLLNVSLGDSHRQRSNASDDTHTLSDADRTARIEDVEKVRALQTQVEGGKYRKPL